MANSLLVTVPLDLLKQVLEQAELDNMTVEGEFACTAENHAEHAEAAQRIRDLRKAAGIAEDE